MKDVLLVAAREFRQIVATRGFWIMLLIVPVAIAISIFATRALTPSPGAAYTMVDASGRYGERIEQRLERDYQTQVLQELSAYVERWKLAEADPAAPWAQRGSWLVPAEVDRFIAQGGGEPALERLTPHLPPGASEFEFPDRLHHRVDAPAGVRTDEGYEAFGEAIGPALKGDVETADGKKRLALAIYIPEDFGAPGAPVRVWTNGGSNWGLLNVVREELTAEIRLAALEDRGLSPEAAVQAQSLSAPLAVTEPPAGEERGVFSTRSIVPLALVYLLLITAMTTGSMMLQGLVEERSNKLLESVLACIRPAALMHGKLLGLGGVGLTIVLVWAGCAVAAGLTSTGAFADALRTSLESISEPWMIPAMIFYFLSGYVIVSMLFLAIGSVSDSMQDAQAFLAPVLIVLMFPVMFMMQAALSDPGSVLVHVLSWIPFYTPFAMLARLGAGVSIAEVIGTVALLCGFIALQLIFIGRLFESSVLSSGKPGWRDLLAKMKARPAGGQGAGG